MKRASRSILYLVACTHGVAPAVAPTEPTTTPAVMAAPESVDTDCGPDALGDGRPRRKREPSA